VWRGLLATPEPRARLRGAESDAGEIVGFARGDPVGPKASDRLDHLADQGFRSAGPGVLRDNHPARRFQEALGALAGPEQSFDLRGQMVAEVACLFQPVSRLA
jgi:hypothetical protein